MLNIYTEEEAKKKYCSSAIHQLGIKPIINCTAGACMAWRFVEEYTCHDDIVKMLPIEKGYCGLSGKPVVN